MIRGRLSGTETLTPARPTLTQTEHPGTVKRKALCNTVSCNPSMGEVFLALLLFKVGHDCD